MSTSHLKYEQPASGTGVATETFTEDSITKHFQRMVTGYKPVTIAELTAGIIINQGDHDLAPCVSMCDGSSDNWTASTAESGAYYINAGVDFDNFMVLGVEADGTMMIPGSAGALTTNRWMVGDSDSLGADTLYVNIGGDPDSEVSGYVKMHYAISCGGASVVRVVPVFSNSGESATVVPVLYQYESSGFLMPLDSISIEETGLDIPDQANLEGYHGHAFDIDVKGALYYAIGIKTAPANGTLTFLSFPV